MLLAIRKNQSKMLETKNTNTNQECFQWAHHQTKTQLRKQSVSVKICQWKCHKLK